MSARGPGEPGPVAAGGDGYAVVVLDTGPLGYVTHPRDELRGEATRWLAGLLRAGARIAVPEVADYELRRKLLHLRSLRAVERLDRLVEGGVVYLPLTTPVMRRAAGLWADARGRGKGTAAPDALDGDVILAAQARVLEEDLGVGVFVATTNPGDLARYVAAGDWRGVGPAIEEEAEDETT